MNTLPLTLAPLPDPRMSRRRFLTRATLTSAAAAALTLPPLLLEGCSTSWITTVEQDLPVIVGIINSILQVISTATGTGLIAAAVSAVLTPAINTLSASLTALNDAVTAYNANKAGGLLGVIAALTAAQKDAQAVIAALPAGVLGATWQTVIIAGLGTAITILSSIQSLIPGAAPAVVTAHAQAAAAKQVVVMPNAAALKTGFNAVLTLNGYAAAEVK